MDSRSSLTRVASTQLVECAEIELVPAWSHHPYVIVFSRFLPGYRKSNLDTQSRHVARCFSLFLPGQMDQVFFLPLISATSYRIINYSEDNINIILWPMA